MFKTIGTDGTTYKLGDFTAKGMDNTGSDFIQFLDPDSAETYLSAYWVDEEEVPGFGGWWDADDLWNTQLDDEEVPAGSAFLLNCGACTEDTPIEFTFSGEVERGAEIVVESVSAFIANPLPVAFKLGEITAMGMDNTGSDFIQFLDPDSAETYMSAYYVNEEEVPGFGGWWDADDLWNTQLDDEDVPAGCAFLLNCGNCTSDTPIYFVFPDPLAPKAE